MPTFLGIDVDDATDRLRARAARLRDGAVPPSVVGVPRHETTRSPAAAVVADAAARAGLFLFHFEHRVPLDVPEHWVVPGREDDAVAPPWLDGVRAERKYHSFRHDQGIGGFHPHHRAKWSTHELLHGLVGWAWRPGASPFFHATASRLAELLPVALWYFFDEAFAVRCRRHDGDGALFRVHCPRCEEPRLPDPERDGRRWVEAGLQFIDRELAAVSRSLRTGEILPHRHATLNLASDGVAYAAAHGPRLESAAMERYALDFMPPGFLAPDLEALEARIHAVVGGLLGDGIPVAPHAAEVWARQDVAWRLSTIREETQGDAAASLDRILDELAAGGDVAAASASYRALFEDWELPEPDDVFALGHTVGGGVANAQGFVEGLRTGLPKLEWVLGDELDSLADAFAGPDLETPRRVPLPLRFAEHLGEVRPESAAAAAFEGAITCLPRGARAMLPQAPKDGRVRAAEGVAVLAFECDAAEVLEALESGSAVPETGPTAYLCGRDPSGEILLVDIEVDWVEGLRSEDGLVLDEATEEALRGLGLIEPVVRL